MTEERLAILRYLYQRPTRAQAMTECIKEYIRVVETYDLPIEKLVEHARAEVELEAKQIASGAST